MKTASKAIMDAVDKQLENATLDYIKRGKLIMVIVTLKCGYTLTGESAPLNPKDFSVEEGQSRALLKARGKLIEYEAYRQSVNQ